MFEHVLHRCSSDNVYRYLYCTLVDQSDTLLKITNVFTAETVLFLFVDLLPVCHKFLFE